MDWSPDEMLSAVRAGLTSRRWDPHLTFERAELVGDLVLVVVCHRDEGTERLGVYYSLAELPAGPKAGIECESPRQWAAEVGWDVEEFVSLKTNERFPGPDGLVVVRWWPGASMAR